MSIIFIQLTGCSTQLSFPYEWAMPLLSIVNNIKLVLSSYSILHSNLY